MKAIRTAADEAVLSRRTGSALVVAMVYTLLTGALATSILLYSLSHKRLAQRQLNLERALFAASAGVEEAAERIEASRGFLGNQVVGEKEFEASRADYTIQKTGWREYEVASVGTAADVTRVVHIDRFYFPTYADYALWSHVNGKIYFIPGEEFFGKVHADDKLWFSSSPSKVGPIFHEKVTTGAMELGGDYEHVEFLKGYQVDRYKGSLGTVDFPDLETQATNHGLVLEGGTRIKFLEGGNMEISNSRMGWDEHIVPIGEDQIVYVKDATSGSDNTAGKVTLEGGIVDGRVTLATDDDILIQSHLVYADDPEDEDYTEDDQDALGLISKDDVWVSEYAPRNLKIHAAIMATGQKPNNDGSFGVLQYDRISTRGELAVFGSIVQDVRGAVGTFNSYGPASGFYKNYTFDQRLKTRAPPYYPPLSEEISYEGWSDGPS